MIFKGQILKAKDVCQLSTGENTLTIGKEYKVKSVDEELGTFNIINDQGELHEFTLEKDENGVGLETFFEAV